MKPEQAKQILADAPEGATHIDLLSGWEVIDCYRYANGIWSEYCKSDNEWIHTNDEVQECCSIHALSDLRTIVEQAERIEAIQKLIESELDSTSYDMVASAMARLLDLWE